MSERLNNFIEPPNDPRDLWSNGNETITFEEFDNRFNGSSTEAIRLHGWNRIQSYWLELAKTAH